MTPNQTVARDFDRILCGMIREAEANAKDAPAHWLRVAEKLRHARPLVRLMMSREDRDQTS